MPTGHRFLATDLHQFVVSLFTHLGSRSEEATLVADHLIAANLAGHDSHGVGMIPSYVKSHAGGFLQLNRHATVTKDAGAVVTLDGNAGFGQVVAHEAMQLGIEKAKQHGMAAIALRNAHHVGRIGYWAEQCAAAGGTACATMNGANEVAVAQFLRGEIGFNDISRRVEQALSRVAVKYQPSLADILEADRLGREAAG